MKLLTTPNQIQTEFRRLLLEFENYYWATAWATQDFNASEILKKNSNRARKIIVGIHFYQTHPNFIKEHIDNENIRYVLKPEGVFHPKIYLFENDERDWECIVGSLNFTKSAFEKNQELAILFNSTDSSADQIYRGLHDSINNFWDNSESFDPNELYYYSELWERKKPILKNISGHKSKKSKSIFNIDILKDSWDNYYDIIKKADRDNSISEKVKVLEKSNELFMKYNKFKDMIYDDRKYIAGYYGTWRDVSRFFGSMQGHGIFKEKIKENDINISNALDEIPLQGEISKNHYSKNIEKYCMAFPKGKKYIGTASRLLCMKRPDYFLCLDSKNKKNLCKDFKLPQSIDYNMYWDDIIERIIDSRWWNSDEPYDPMEKALWKGRVAFLDVNYYEGIS